MPSERGQIDVVVSAGGLVWRGDADGRRVAVVHRERHDDWSLPKGKLEDGEGPEEAALREVAEEVGCRARVTGYAGRLSYDADGEPKVVFFWHMEPQERIGEPSEDEIDRVEWLGVDEALERLSYEGERDLLRRSGDRGT